MLNFNQNQSAAAPKSTGNGNKSDKPKAQVWVNVGHSVTVKVFENGVDTGRTEDRFISLPVGIALDTTEHLPVRGSSEEFRAFTTARNDLLDQVMAAANELAPGEARIVNLQIELRRVQDEAETIKPESNPFAVKVNL